MRIFIAGICGTFMGGIAQLAKAVGHDVRGCDANVYPPMSTQLICAGIEVLQGFELEHLEPKPDVVIIGNALSRGNPLVEAVLNQGLPYTSGPQWLSENILRDKWVLATSGTHGKTSTSSMLAWVLEYAGMSPGFLIGGVPENFGVSARLGDTPFFVVEADEYDTAFFDKRSKFVHYKPRTAIINNLEFDHADIFKDLNAIQTQFHHFIRCIPSEGRIIAPTQDKAVADTLALGCWSEIETFGVGSNTANHKQSKLGWEAKNISEDGTAFDIYFEDKNFGRLSWSLLGEHNINNALAVIASARHVGVTPEVSIQALAQFENVKRRMEVKGCVNGVTVYDDFAHHPTAIATTVSGLRKKVKDARILAVLEPRSNSMRMGVHADALLPSLSGADEVFLYFPKHLAWDLPEVKKQSCQADATLHIFDDIDALVSAVVQVATPNSHILVMSNGGFGGIHQKLLEGLATQ